MVVSVMRMLRIETSLSLMMPIVTYSQLCVNVQAAACRWNSLRTLCQNHKARLYWSEGASTRCRQSLRTSCKVCRKGICGIHPVA